MNLNGGTRFNDVDFNDDEIDFGEVKDDSEDEADGAPRKRAKTAANSQPSANLWSNPEYYTALPPPENKSGPKKDFVNAIRKAKVKADSAPKLDASDAIKSNADFISFDDPDDQDHDQDQDQDDLASVGVRAESEESNYKPAMPAVPAHATLQSVSAMPATISSGHQMGVYANGNHGSSSIALPDRVGLPPRPPPSLMMPTDAELAAEYGNLGPPAGKKRKRQDQATGPDGVVAAWRANPQAADAAPWHQNYHHPEEAKAIFR